VKSNNFCSSCGEFKHEDEAFCEFCIEPMQNEDNDDGYFDFEVEQVSPLTTSLAELMRKMG
jgi:hypothetical protein